MNQTEQLTAGRQAPGSRYIIGTDEVGYGAWAGPLVVTGAVFLEDWEGSGVMDSKTLTHQKRQVLARTVIGPALIRSLTVRAHSSSIDRDGVGPTLRRLHCAVIRVLLAVYPASQVIVDGDLHIEVAGAEPGQVVCVAGADSRVPAVGAASILAKLDRDEKMVRADTDWPDYGFAAHKGYGTPQHQKALALYGPCAIHRRSYRPVARAAAAFASREVQCH